MKKNVTYVDAARFETAIVASGLPYTLQAGFVKVSGPKGRNIYVAATKRVGRVDLSGFEMAAPGITDLGDMAFGNVKQQLDFTRTEDEILATFADLLEHVKTLAPVEKLARKASAPKAPVAQGWSTEIPKDDKAARLAAIKAAHEKASSQTEA